MSFHVDPSKTHLADLRQRPRNGMVITRLPQGTGVRKLGEWRGDPAWWQVMATLHGGRVCGFIHSDLLRPGRGIDGLPAPGAIPECHLPPSGHGRRADRGRSFPLDEETMPERVGPGSPAGLVRLVNWLDPAERRHGRYRATGGRSHCAVYACDYCRLAGAYLPRVWWTGPALRLIADGRPPAVLYDTTVREVTANGLHDWLADYGAAFGWRRLFEVAALQANADEGRVALIVARRYDGAGPGRVALVIPEHGGIAAARSGGAVVRPVQSFAGPASLTAGVPASRWWLGDEFPSFGMWVHP